MGGSIFSLAWRSVWNRRASAVLTIFAIALSVALFLGVEKARKSARTGFESTISGTHLIVGAPTGQVNLLLYSVFRIGNATAEMSWEAYETLGQREDVAWTIPISLGDNHRGYRVLGTNQAYFDHYQYGPSQGLEFRHGKAFGDIYQAVLGASAARELGYALGDEFELTHGLGEAEGLSDHDDKHFHVVGILAPTGTPVDRTIHIPLEGMTAIHVGWESGTKSPLADTIDEHMIRSFDLTPHTITAAFIGLKNKGTVLRTAREINTDRTRPLLAIMPGEALRQLWEVIGSVERILLAVSAFVIAVGLVSILTSILTSLNERRREMSVLRAVGAQPGHILGLMMMEAAGLGLIGAILGTVLIQLIFAIAAPVLSANYGIALIGTGIGLTDLLTVVAVTLAALLLGLWPAITALKRSLADGLTVKT